MTKEIAQKPMFTYHSPVGLPTVGSVNSHGCPLLGKFSSTQFCLSTTLLAGWIILRFFDRSIRSIPIFCWSNLKFLAKTPFFMVKTHFSMAKPPFFMVKPIPIQLLRGSPEAAPDRDHVTGAHVTEVIAGPHCIVSWISPSHRKGLQEGDSSRNLGI